MAHSKSYGSFKNRMLHFDDDIEFTDILYSTIKESTVVEGANKLFNIKVQISTLIYHDTLFAKIIACKLCDI